MILTVVCLAVLAVAALGAPSGGQLETVLRFEAALPFEQLWGEYKTAHGQD